MEILFLHYKEYRQQFVPASWQQEKIANAQTAFIKTESGQYLRQLLLGRGFALEWHHLSLDESTVAHFRVPEEALTLFFTTEGTFRHTTAKMVTIQVPNNTYRLLHWKSRKKYKTVFDKGQMRFFLIHFYKETDGETAEFASDLFPLPNGADTQPVGRPFPILLKSTEIMNELQAVDTEPKLQQLLFESAVRNLLRIYLDQYNKRKVDAANSSAQQQLLKRTEDYIRSHLSDRLTVSILAKKMNVSRAWLQRLSQRHYKKGIYYLVIEIRMMEAAELLLHTSTPVRSICLKVSNMTFSAFTAAFKKRFSQTPSAYRRNSGRLT